MEMLVIQIKKIQKKTM